MKKKIICIFICMLLIAIIPLSTEAILISKKNREKISYFESEIDDVGWYTSLALYNDIPHICYYDYSNGDLKYAYWDGSNWNVEVVDSEGNVGRYASIDLDSNNYPHISYYDYGKGALKYAYWDGIKWRNEEIAKNKRGQVGMYTCIAIDGNDLPHISYCDYGERTLNYAHWTGSSWDKKVIDSSAEICVFEYFGDYTSISLDSNDNPHISYCDFENYDLKYAYYTGSKWNKEVVDSDGLVGQYSSIAIDEYDNPHISYGYLENSHQVFDLKYATKSGNTWSIEVVDHSGDVRKWTSIALDSLGLPHISYYDYWEGALKYTFNNGTSWNFQTIDLNGSTGCFNSLKLNSVDKPCISYYDWGNKALKYATFQQDVWDVQVIEIDTNTDFLDQEQNYCCGYATQIPVEQPAAQSFIPNYKVLTRIELMLVKRYNPGSFTASIRSDLYSEDLTHITFNSNEIEEDMAWKNFDIPDIEINPGETYYIVYQSETQDYNMYYSYFGIYDSYVNGCAWVFDNINNVWKKLNFGSSFPDVDFGFKTFGLNTSIPKKPVKPSGPISGTINIEYTYNTSSIDPDGDQLFYLFDWGDGIDSGWLGPYLSGSTVEAKHIWTKKGTYNVKVKAKDEHGAESQWSDPQDINIPRDKTIVKNYIIKIFERLAYFFPFLKYTFGNFL